MASIHLLVLPFLLVCSDYFKVMLNFSKKVFEQKNGDLALPPLPITGKFWNGKEIGFSSELLRQPLPSMLRKGPFDKLKEAKSNRQFSTSLEQAKEVFPESLMIVGQNPMAVLHRVCSEAIHNHTDEECLDIAITTRKLLIAF